MCRTDASPDTLLITERTRKTGPEPERVKVDLDFEEAIKRALAKQRPPGGWPRPKKGRAKKGAK